VKRRLAAGWLIATIACSKPAEPPPGVTPAESTAPAPLAASAAGTVTGRIEGGANATTVVVLESKIARAFAPATDEPMMDQAQVTFIPELLLVRTGQPVEFHNSDDTLHNVHVTHEETKTPAFNVAIPTDGSYEYTFDRDGFYHVGCDIHTEMSASIFAWSSPFAVLAGPDGSFAFADVPAGAWTVTAYAGARRLTQSVEVHSGVTQVRLR
jgi:plastocyanin